MKFEEVFNSLDHSKFITKHSNYLELYEEYLSRFKNREKVNLLEIGLLDGGSINLWMKYFGNKLNFYGIDINPRCKNYEKDNVVVYIGSQSDEKFLSTVANETPQLDVIIDDGGHTMKQQVNSFKSLFPKLSEGGIYICEDCHTSYWYPYGGGIGRKETFIEFAKKLIDELHATEFKKGNEGYYSKNIKGIHFHDSMVIIEKKTMTERTVISKGKYSGENEAFAGLRKSKFYFIFHKKANQFLSLFGMKGYSYIFGPGKD